MDGRRVVLGVSASIAAYKAVAIASQLTQQGALVDVIMTPEAAELVRPLSFEAITHRPVAFEMFRLIDSEIAHVALARSADVFLVAPATAHTIAKLAIGLADDLVSATALSCQAPQLLAPAMESGMWQHPATVDHVKTLRERGWTIVEPGVGHLASGAVGEGRLAEPEQIVDVTKHVLARGGDLAGWRVTITAGGTREPLDPVRFLSNRSSGKMGLALAEAARDRGADVTLIWTSGADSVPHGVQLVEVEQAEEMRAAVLAALPRTDLLVMAAAVADYRPAEAVGQKIKKASGMLALDLAPTVDVLQEVSKVRGPDDRTIVVGFAAETESVLDNARKKLVDKRLDLVVANDVTIQGSGFGSDFNQVSILQEGEPDIDLPLLPKIEVAHHVYDAVLRMSGASRDPSAEFRA
ncbi:MAG TPA: bifunctional phosphopantothenoylcysteine decarboxylase/phosphopantothenate--cysteine ligase CoaBC [Chloroflexota bacterium]